MRISIERWLGPTICQQEDCVRETCVLLTMQGNSLSICIACLGNLVFQAGMAGEQFITGITEAVEAIAKAEGK